MKRIQLMQVEEEKKKKDSVASNTSTGINNTNSTVPTSRSLSLPPTSRPSSNSSSFRCGYRSLLTRSRPRSAPISTMRLVRLETWSSFSNSSASVIVLYCVFARSLEECSTYAGNDDPVTTTSSTIHICCRSCLATYRKSGFWSGDPLTSALAYVKVPDSAARPRRRPQHPGRVILRRADAILAARRRPQSRYPPVVAHLRRHVQWNGAGRRGGQHGRRHDLV